MENSKSLLSLLLLALLHSSTATPTASSQTAASPTYTPSVPQYDSSQCTIQEMNQRIGRIGLEFVPPGVDLTRRPILISETTISNFRDCYTACIKEPLCEHHDYQQSLRLCKFYRLALYNTEFISKSSDVVKIEANNRIDMSVVFSESSSLFFSCIHNKYLESSYLFDGLRDTRSWEPTFDFFSTTNQSEPWVQITLERPSCVGGVVIWNRHDSTNSQVAERTQNVEVRVAADNTSLSETASLCTYLPGQFPTSRVMTCDSGPIFGQVVQVKMIAYYSYLSLFEVIVYGF